MAKKPINWRRVLRPLWSWLLLVLVLFLVHTHQRLSEQTRLYYLISLKGQPLPYPVNVTLDGKPINNGDKIQLGNHRFEIASAKTDPFITKLFVWYGRHDLGDIKLQRSMGTLTVKANPPAQSIAISGSEFSTNLYDSSGASLILPTDDYSIKAQYPHWSGSQTVSVVRSTTVPVTFSPQFGALHLTCNREGATFQLQDENGQILESGGVPETLIEFPAGRYQVTFNHHGHPLQKNVTVKANMTNEVSIQFEYGTAVFESNPSGASVYSSDNRYRGVTPLQLPEVMPQTLHFKIELNGYQSIEASVDVVVDQTNVFRTNLISFDYLNAMQEARTYWAESNYQATVQETVAALKAEPNDTGALTLQNKADEHLNTQRQQLERLERPKRAFDALCDSQLNANLFAEHDLITGKKAADVAAAIVCALTNAPSAFEILQDNSPKPEIYEIVAKKEFSLGILGGTERDVLIVVGQPKDDLTEIRFKVLEYEVQHTEILNGLSLHDQKEFIPIHPSRMRMTDALQRRLQEGVQIVTEKIQQAIAL